MVGAVVVLDPVPPGGGSNLVHSGPDGLYVECADVRGCLSAGDGAAYDPTTGEISARVSTDAGNTTIIGGDGGIYTPAASTAVTVADSASVDLGLTGSGGAGDPYGLTAAVRLDGTPPGGGSNLIQEGPDGLFVECAQVRGCFSAGDGADYDPLTGVVSARVSTDAGNQVSIGGDGGLFAPSPAPPALEVTDSLSLDLELSGTGTALDPFSVSGAVILDPTPPGGGANLVQLGPDGLFVECAGVLDCISAGDGASYNTTTGEVEARLSTDAGNTVIFGADGGLYVPTPDLPVVGCGLTGDGTTSAPITVVPEAGQEAWPWACDVAVESTLKCDPTTGGLWTPPEHYSAMDHIYIDHFAGGWADPLVPVGGWTIIDPNAFIQFDVPPHFVGNMCRPWGYEVNALGNWDVSYTADAIFEFGYVLVVDGGPPEVKPMWGPLSAFGAPRRERANGGANATFWGLPATSGALVVMYPAVYVQAGSLTLSGWISDATIHTTTNTP
ncbi:hypothetical protein OG216_19325 [Streptomycetaceae bacterium NBC_01309]